jgi:hypothetical protein
MIPGVVAQPHKGPASVHISIASPLRASASPSYTRGKAISVAIGESLAGSTRKLLRGVVPIIHIGEVMSAGRSYTKSAIASFGIGSLVSLRRSTGKFVRVLLGQALVKPSMSAQASQFLARSTGLDVTHQNAYINMIDGLVADGVWTKLDVLYIFATANSTSALLNLVSSNFTGVAHGSPAFVADRGFTGVDGSTTVYIDTQFNPTTATGPQFTTNSCHVSAWSNTDVTAGASGGALIGDYQSGTTNITHIVAKNASAQATFRINDGTASGAFSSSSSIGHWVASRTGASASAGYNNGSLFASPNAAAGTLQNFPFAVLAENGAGGIVGGTACELAMASIGAGLTATDVNNLYNRVANYLSAIGMATARATQVTLQVLRSET